MPRVAQPDIVAPSIWGAGMQAKRLMILTLILLLPSACSVPRPEPIAGLSCRIGEVSTDIDVDLAPMLTTTTNAAAQPVEVRDASALFFESTLTDVLDKRRQSARPMSETRRQQPLTQLILSGGGQEGALGTGFLKGASQRKDLRDYDVVTGVSTGALQATFALLGNTQYDRPDFVGDFEPRLPGATALDDLVSGYTISRPDSLFENHGEIAIIRKAAQGSFRPLDTRIRELLQPQVFAALHEKEVEGRKLLVALLNWDSGRAVVIDMMKLAELHAGKFETQRSCFTQVLIAASSEPLAVPPVNIDGTLYMDAGLRFGVFSKGMVDGGERFAATQSKIAATARADDPSIVRVRSDVIVNGQLADADEGKDPPAQYNALDLIGRARHILVTQVYRFSVADVMRHGPGHATRLVYIDPPLLAEIGAPAMKPFDPAYMKRLIKAGIKRGSADAWTLTCEPTRPCTAPASAIQK